jgi:hypothetical protein
MAATDAFQTPSDANPIIAIGPAKRMLGNQSHQVENSYEWSFKGDQVGARNVSYCVSCAVKHL